jgi:hypothetical protein
VVFISPKAAGCQPMAPDTLRHIIVIFPPVFTFAAGFEVDAGATVDAGLELAAGATVAAGAGADAGVDVVGVFSPHPMQVRAQIRNKVMMNSLRILPSFIILKC